MPTLIGSPPVEITLRRTRRAKRFSLRVSSLDGRVTLTLPGRARLAEAMDFARAQEGWIRGALAALPVRAPVGVGTLLPVEGRMLEVQPTGGRLVRVDGDALLVPGAAETVAVRVAAFLRVLARDRLGEASDRHAARIGAGVSRITLRDTRSRWGSCTADGALMYSWRLAMAPVEVLDYVAAHEVAHLVEMNHAPAFWAVVRRLKPDYAQHRAWLREHGPSLQRYAFERRG